MIFAPIRSEWDSAACGAGGYDVQMKDLAFQCQFLRPEEVQAILDLARSVAEERVRAARARHVATRYG